MNVTTGGINEYGSCNYCEKGRLDAEKKKLVYPYEYVISVSGKQASTTFCQECFDALKKIEVR